MKTYFVEDFRRGEEVTDFFMAKSIGIRIGSNGKQYLDLVLSDKTGEISAKKWDISGSEYEEYGNIEPKSIVKVRLTVVEWAGQLQGRVQKIRLANADDNQVITDFVKSAPEDSEEMYNYIFKVADNLGDEDYRALTTRILEENKERLLYYPAASRNHHAEFGGLLYHTKRMLMSGERLCDIYKNLNKDLVLTGVIIHDIEKLNEIESDEMGMSDSYSFEGQMLGHLVQGIKLIDRLGLEMDIPYEKRIMLEHMILTHHYEPEFGSPKKPLFPEAELLHYLDILDARMFDFEDALKSVEKGAFSEKVWALDNRKLYKPEGDK